MIGRVFVFDKDCSKSIGMVFVDEEWEMKQISKAWLVEGI